MHELGIAFHLIDTVIDVAHQNNVSHVKSVTISLGEVSGVIPEYLNSVWEWACKKHDETQGTKLNIKTIEALTYCEDCKKRYPTIQYGKICPHCGSENTYLVQGNEFTLKEIEVD